MMQFVQFLRELFLKCVLIEGNQLAHKYSENPFSFHE